MKKLGLSLLALACSTLALSSCGGSKNEEGKIKIWWPGSSDAQINMIEEAKKQYTELHPEVQIEIVPQSTTNFYMNYNLSLTGNDFPDICYVDHVYVQRLMNDGAIANLSELGFDSLKDQFVDSLWAPNTYDDQLYALPISANVLATCYNKTLLSEVTGKEFTKNDLPKSYDEFFQLSEKINKYNTDNSLTGANQYIPTTIPAGNGNESMAAMTFLSYTAREGGKIISDDLKTMNLNSKECLAAAEKIKEMGEKGFTTTVFNEAKFEAGKVAFIEIGPWKFQDYDRISKNKNIDFEYAPIMNFYEDGTNNSALGLFSMVVTDKSVNKEIAADFVKFVTTNDELQLLYNKPQNLMPATKNALNDTFYKEDRWKVFTDQLQNVVARPGSPEWPTIELQLAGFVTQLISGSREPSYLKSLNAVLQQALDEIYA